jgi:hypothetical protein
METRVKMIRKKGKWLQPLETLAWKKASYAIFTKHLCNLRIKTILGSEKKSFTSALKFHHFLVHEKERERKKRNMSLYISNNL